MDRSIAPNIKNAVDMSITLPPLESVVLNNNIPLYYYNGGGEEVFSLEVVFPCGTFCETKKLQMMLVSGLIKQGTINHDSKTFNDAIEFYGATFSTNYDYETFTVSMSGLTKFIKPLLSLFTDMICNPIFDQKEFNTYLSNAKQNMQINITKPDFISNQLFDSKVFGAEHPYGKYSTLVDYDKITKDEIKDFYFNNISLLNSNIFFAGKFSNNDLNEIVNHFNSIKNIKKSNIPEWNFNTNASTERFFEIKIKEDSVQGVVTVGREFVDMDHADFMPMIILNTILGGYFGSRLMSNIREDKGYTYGIYSSLAVYKKSSLLKITTDVNINVMKDTLNQIEIEMEKLQNKNVSNKELLVVKNYLLSSIISRLDGPFNIIKRWKGLMLNNYDVNRFNKSIEIYKHVTPNEIKALAQKYYTKKELYKMTVC